VELWLWRRSRGARGGRGGGRKGTDQTIPSRPPPNGRLRPATSARTGPSRTYIRVHHVWKEEGLCDFLRSPPPFRRGQANSRKDRSFECGGGAGQKDGKKKASKGGAVDSVPIPVRSEAATMSIRRPSTATAKAAPAPRKPAGLKATVDKPAGKKAAKSQGIGTVVPPDQFPKTKRKRKKAAFRRHLLRSAAVGLSVVPGSYANLSMTRIIKRVRTDVPDYLRFGIKEVPRIQKGWLPGGDGLRLDMNRLNTSHSQRLNSGKPLGTGRCGWWCPIDPCPNEPLTFRGTTSENTWGRCLFEGQFIIGPLEGGYR